MSLENDRYFAKLDQKIRQNTKKSKEQKKSEELERQISIVENQLINVHQEKFEGYKLVVERLEKRLEKLRKGIF